MKIIVKVEGLREIHQALQELPKSTGRNVARRILKKYGQEIADAAKSRVPVLFGDLKKSIVVSTKLTRRQRSQHRKEGPNDVEVFVGPGAYPYAHMQEFGTRRNRAHPYLRPAWDSLSYAIVDKIRGDMWAEIEKAAARRARKLAKGK